MQFLSLDWLPSFLLILYLMEFNLILWNVQKKKQAKNKLEFIDREMENKLRKEHEKVRNMGNNS